jgi:fructose-1,6-bisphosphatase I
MTTIDAVFETVAATASDVRAALSERRAYEEDENPSGEQQLAAEVYADELLEERLLAIDDVGTYASEEREDAIPAADGGSYHVACDPLDGSSNLKSNNGMGTIVAVFDSELPASGESLVAAGYVLYGPITTMLEASDGTLTEYLIEDDGRTVLNDDITLPDDPTVYGFGGRIPDWTTPFRAYVDDIEDDRLKLRYGGAMVADVNQVVTYGGVFGYPMLEGAPEGKLRLQFEGHPIAHIVETAGGASSNGSQSLLSCDPDELHERTPLFVGNEPLIERLEAVLAEG